MTSGTPEVLSSPRSGDAYNAHSYHTKVPAGAIAALIERHLPRGGVVADPFCGSGSTGVAAAIAERALPATGRYDVLLGDLSPYATFIAEGLNRAPNEEAFERSVRDCLDLARREIGALWSTNHSDGRSGEIMYTVWSELLICPRCRSSRRFWDQAVDLDDGAIRRTLACPCGHEYRKDQAERVTEQLFDPFIGESIERIVREPVVIAYEVDGERHEKVPDDDDLAVIEAAARLTAPAACPKRRMLNRTGPWGDLHRAGYHRGITHAHHFYTWRNFITLGHLWDAAAHTKTRDAVDEIPDVDPAAAAVTLAGLFERAVGESGRRDLGAVYTPPDVVDFMAREAIAARLADGLQLTLESTREMLDGDLRNLTDSQAMAAGRSLKGLRLVDPAVGAGAFLTGAATRLAKLAGKLSRMRQAIDLRPEAGPGGCETIRRSSTGARRRWPCCAIDFWPAHDGRCFATKTSGFRVASPTTGSRPTYALA